MAIGRAVQKGWNGLGAKYDLHLHVGGIPPLSHFGFDGEGALEVKALFVQTMLQHGYLASTSFYSMVAHTWEHVEGYLAAADKTFALIAEKKLAGKVRESLEGAPSVAGFKRLT